MAVGITVQFTIKPGANEQFEAGFRKAAAAVKAQDEGCEMYDLFKSVDSPTRYVMVERWTTPELALEYSSDPEELKNMIANGGMGGPGGVKK